MAERELFEVDGVEYEIRKVRLPDGSEGTLGCVPGSFDHMSDEEIFAMMSAALPPELGDA